MQAPYAQQFQKLENQRHLYTQLVTSAPADVVLRAPERGKWSAAQVVYHLAVIDAMVAGSLEKTLRSEKPLRAKSTKTILKSLLLQLLLKLPIKFKAPSVLGKMPEQVALPQVLSDWEAARERLAQVLETFPASLREKEVFRHPRTGMMTLGQTLAFLHEHHAHHYPQLQQALR